MLGNNKFMIENMLKKYFILNEKLKNLIEENAPISEINNMKLHIQLVVKAMFEYKSFVWVKKKYEQEKDNLAENKQYSLLNKKNELYFAVIHQYLEFKDKFLKTYKKRYEYEFISRLSTLTKYDMICHLNRDDISDDD